MLDSDLGRGWDGGTNSLLLLGLGFLRRVALAVGLLLLLSNVSMSVSMSMFVLVLVLGLLFCIWSWSWSWFLGFGGLYGRRGAAMPCHAAAMARPWSDDEVAAEEPVGEGDARGWGGAGHGGGRGGELGGGLGGDVFGGGGWRCALKL